MLTVQVNGNRIVIQNGFSTVCKPHNMTVFVDKASITAFVLHLMFLLLKIYLLLSYLFAVYVTYFNVWQIQFQQTMKSL